MLKAKAGFIVMVCLGLFGKKKEKEESVTPGVTPLQPAPTVAQPQQVQQVQQQPDQQQQKTQEPELFCPQCNGPTNFIDKYKKWYCNSCVRTFNKDELRIFHTVEQQNIFKQEEQEDVQQIAVAPDVNPCPECLDPLEFIDQEKRHYCRTCRKYVDVE
jgi:predicted amidophosphoribosyltransferase